MNDEAKPIVRLTRLILFRNICVFGLLEDEQGNRYGNTIEQPWHHNEPNHSCIPAGVYGVKPYNSPTKGNVFRLNDADTEPRTAIEIHHGNLASQTRGCILVGLSCGMLVVEGRPEPAVLESDISMGFLLRDFPNGFTLHIEDKT